ncbi:MAG: DUF3618 domain-containing protein [Gemmatimonadaceae bacterium]
MAETSDEIRRQIEDTRARIGGTIAALEHKIDPKRIVDEHPLTIVGVAFGAGLLLSTTGATGRAAREVTTQVRAGAHKINSGAGTALDGIVDAIVGAATATITTKMNELLQVMFDSAVKPRGKSGRFTRAA